MASSSWIWITPPRFFVALSPMGNFHTPKIIRGNLQSREWMWIWFLVLDILDIFGVILAALDAWHFQLTLIFVPAFFHDWINETCVYLSLSAYAKKIHWAHHHHWKTAWAEWVPKAASARLEVIVMLSRLMNLYDSMIVERNLLHEMVLSKWDDLLLLCCRFKGIQYGSLAENIASIHQFN